MKDSLCFGGTHSLHLHAGIFLGLLINSEDGGDIFFRNVILLSPNYMALQPRSQNHRCENFISHVNVLFFSTVFRGLISKLSSCFHRHENSTLVHSKPVTIVACSYYKL
jgi:hypothetical protein